MPISCRRSSISKLRGAEISSRLMPPKTGAISFTVSTILSVSCVSRQIGKASIPANRLNNMAFPSITGIAAFAPIFPNPNTGTFLLQADPTFRELTIDMYALTGQRVFSESWNPTSGNKEFSPTLSPGIYQVLIYEQNNLVSHEKMVILKH